MAGIGTILLIIPGIILILGFSQVDPIIVDNPDLPIIDVIKKSWEIMNGHKMEFLVFILSFILWIIACILVVPAIYAVPYIEFASAIYYTKLIGETSKAKKEEKKEAEATE